MRALQRKSLLVVVSNVDHASFGGTRPRLRVVLDELVTAEDVGAYKPDPRLLAAALERLRAKGIAREQVVHVAQSLFHDIAATRRLSIPSAWFNRKGGPVPAGTEAVPAFPTLAAFADWLAGTRSG